MCIAAALTITLYSVLVYNTAIEAGLIFWLMFVPLTNGTVRHPTTEYCWSRLVSNGFRHIVYVLDSNTQHTNTRSQFESRIRWCTNGTGSSNKRILYDHFINIKMCFASFLVLFQLAFDLVRVFLFRWARRSHMSAHNCHEVRHILNGSIYVTATAFAAYLKLSAFFVFMQCTLHTTTTIIITHIICVQLNI